jgi:hypothetical protein
MGGGEDLNYIGIDTGRKITKVAGEETLTFPSVVGSARRLHLENEADYDVKVDGKHFFVGWLADESYDRREMASKSKIHEETKVLFLTALALMISPDDSTVIISGLPVAQNSTETKILFNGLVQGKHQVEMKGKRIMANVDCIQVVPEGAGAWWDAVLNEHGRITDHTLLRQQVTRVLDLGSRTINYLTLLEGGHYLDRCSGTLNYGCMELDNEDNDPERFTRRIMADLTKEWPDMKRSDLLFLTGGGATLLRDHFAKEFQTMLVACNPITANVRGYRKLGMGNSGRKNYML